MLYTSPRDTFTVDPEQWSRQVGRRGIKEYRASEALQLILADRDHLELECPSCGAGPIERTPPRRRSLKGEGIRQVSLKCSACGRQASYVPRNVTQRSATELTF